MKIKKYVFFFSIFSLVGCSSVTMNNKREYKDTLSYKTSAFIADANCFQSLGIIKNGEYYEKTLEFWSFIINHVVIYIIIFLMSAKMKVAN
ncbi:hypothetical protein CQA25_15630 [Morganella morganii]|nr:hypothetical protein CQA25_15630 [Morganella morganii]